MPMSPTYPFSMLWTRYTDTELITEATAPLGQYDRADLIELVVELARRLEEELNYAKTRTRR